MLLRHYAPASSESARGQRQSARAKVFQEICDGVPCVKENIMSMCCFVGHQGQSFGRDGGLLTAARMMNRRGCFLMRAAVSKIGSTVCMTYRYIQAHSHTHM
jgi:hypothetical protein